MAPKLKEHTGPRMYLSEKMSQIAEANTLETDLIGTITLGPSMNGPFEPSKINMHRHKGIPLRYKLYSRIPKGLRHPIEVCILSKDY